MAIDFNGTTSRLVNTTAALGITTGFTACFFIFTDGEGEASSGIILCVDENETGFSINTGGGANELRFFVNWSGTNGTWDIPCTDGVWHHVALSYDGQSDANVPVVRVDGEPVTVTVITSPTTAWEIANAGYCIGNRNNQAQTVDGGIENMRVYPNTILTADEMDREYQKPGSVTRGRGLWITMENAADITDRSGNGFDGVATALTDRTGPTISVPPGSRRLVVSHRNPDTTVGEVNALLVDKSRLTGPDGTEPGRLVIERIQWNVAGGGTVTLAWDHTTDDIATVLTGEGDRTYPGNGLVDPASAGGTGDLLLSASDVAGGSYEIKLLLRMKD